MRNKNWEDLKELASKYEGYRDCGECFNIKNLCFWKDGDIFAESSKTGNAFYLAHSLSYKRIMNIIKNNFKETIE